MEKKAVKILENASGGVEYYTAPEVLGYR